MAAILIGVESTMLLRLNVFDPTAMAATPRRDTLTCTPAVNKGGVDILPGIEAATGAVRITDRPKPDR